MDAPAALNSATLEHDQTIEKSIRTFIAPSIRFSDTALKSAPSETVAQWIAQTEDRRKASELRLRSMTTGEGLTATELRDLVERMQGIVAILQSASSEDRRRVQEAAQLSITYDHEGKRAKLHASPDPGVWSSVRVGGASRTLTPQAETPWINLAA